MYLNFNYPYLCDLKIVKNYNKHCEKFLREFSLKFWDVLRNFPKNLVKIIFPKKNVE